MRQRRGQRVSAVEAADWSSIVICARKLSKSARCVRCWTGGSARISVIRLMLLSLCIPMQQTLGAQQQGIVCERTSVPTTTEVVEKLIEMNLRRAHALHSYRSIRTYRLEYRGLFGLTKAEMVVDVIYRTPGTKEFTIQSSTGSNLMIDKVFKKLLQAERDALSVDGQRRTALSNENYEFTMVRYEDTAFRRIYVLAVEPKTDSRFLFRGRVWVDGDDFAVIRLEAEPAKSPSIWTKSSQIEQSYQKVSDFWLPQRNHSSSSIRLGGRAELTIEYQNYRITESEPVASENAAKLGCPASTTLSQTTNAR